MVEAYWQIGKRIVEQEQHGEDRAAYGEGILKELSKALTAEFGKGFFYANLRNFRQFYLTYSDHEICYSLCSKLTWSHNRLIMRVENTAARSYYLREAAILTKAGTAPGAAIPHPAVPTFGPFTIPTSRTTVNTGAER